MNVRRVVISGWYGSGNIGDDALLDTLLDAIYRRYGDGVAVDVLAEVPRRIVAAHGHRRGLRTLQHYSFLRWESWPALLGRGDLWKLLRSLREADLFLLGGGGLVQDANGVRNLVRYLDECLLAKLCGASVMYFGVGIGPLVTGRGRRIARWVSRFVDVIAVRDRDGAKLLQEIGVPEERIAATADPALLLDPGEEADGVVGEILAGLPPGGRIVGFCPRGRVSWSQLDDASWERFLQEMARFCDALVRDRGARVVFVPFMCEDGDVIRAIRGRMTCEQGVLSVEQNLTPKQVKRLIREFRYLIGTRLHSLIFAAAESVPFVAVNYAPKIAGFCREVGNNCLLVDEATFDAAACLHYLDGVERDYEKVREALRTEVSARKAAAQATFDRAWTLLERRPERPAGKP